MAGKYPDGDFYQFEADLDQDELNILHRVREWAQSSVRPHAAEYWNRSEFPHHLLPEIAELDIISLVRGKGRSRLLAGLVTAEVHRADASVGTFFSGHDGLFTGSIELLGSEEQKARWLPELYSVEKNGVFAITEPDAGSDVAQGMSTTARRVSGGWILNGVKRWIGNATISDYVAVYARDPEDNQVKGFVVETQWEGYEAKLIENRIALRSVQNADIHLTEVFVPDTHKLEHSNSFKDVNQVLKSARSVVGWQAVGLQMATLDVALAYTGKREQFGKPLSGFQINQAKLSTILGNLISSQSMMVSLARLEERGSVQNEHSALAKAHSTKAMRESVALGRELLGGNGIISDYEMAKIFSDAEAIYSYEGTYDINQLVAARSITGVSAFV
ncbi:acyl-CoA dehydrogenase family protein [Garicola koreensis]|uniref:acyl-CoA dehydrogenase family protein n=1 Tax=Garicola koreensis TaxID=1262554 RepID=UPI0031E9BA03